MKPSNIIINGLGIFLISFAIACGGGERSSEDRAPENKTEGSEAKKESASATYTKDADDMAYAATEETAEPEEAPLSNEKNATSDNGLQQVFSSTIAMVDPNDTIHKFVRTGDIRFKVKQVADATYRIEDITRKYKGFVTYTSLNSRIDRTVERTVSKDSILRTSYYTVENTITIRVPSSKLDTTLKEISRLVAYLDYRNLSANDVRLQILSNKLEKRRLAAYNKRMSQISNNGNANYMDDKAYIEENILQKQAEEDQTLIDDLSLEDQIEYSTITISIYQDQETLHTLIANEDNIEGFKPSLGNRLVDSLKAGWSFIEDVVVGLVAAWPLWIMISVILIILRKNGYLKRRKSE